MRRRATALALSAVLSLSVAACGGSNDEAGDAGAAQTITELQAPPAGGQRQAPTEEQQQALRGFTDCLREEGVDVPENPGGQGGGQPPFDPDDPNLQQAFEACQDQLPEGAGPGGGGGFGPPPSGGGDGESADGESSQ